MQEAILDRDEHGEFYRVKSGPHEMLFDREFWENRPVNSLVSPVGHGAKRTGVVLTQSVHKLVCPCPAGKTPDHIDRNALNNRKYNLRPATAAQQNVNRCLKNRSGYKGVALPYRSKRFQAQGWTGSKFKHLGMFDTAEEAARAHDRFAVELHGEFAYLNFPNEAK